MLAVSARLTRGAFALDASFAAEADGVVALFGASGAGKTTLADTIAGLVRPEAGRIALEDRVLFDSEAGVNLRPERRRIGYVFQDGRLFPPSQRARQPALRPPLRAQGRALCDAGEDRDAARPGVDAAPPARHAFGR